MEKFENWTDEEVATEMAAWSAGGRTRLRPERAHALFAEYEKRIGIVREMKEAAAARYLRRLQGQDS